MILKVVPGVAIVCVALIGNANADIIFGSGSSPANLNVKWTEVDSTSATGQVGVDDVVVAIANTDMNVSPGGTQLEAAATPLTSVVFTPIGDDWRTFELNPEDGAGGTFVLKALDEDGNEFVSGTFTFGNGSNRVWAQAINGQSISQLTIEAASAEIAEIRQVRIQAIPEPSTYALCGAAVLGLFLLRRRKKT
jgi:hypothetical protein